MDISQLHYITQTGPNGESHAEMAEHACRAGVRWVQLRIKDISDESFREEALKTQQICKEWNATFIINDRVHIAAEINADGVHIGKNDLPVPEARTILGESKIIGATANTLDDVQQHIASKADYVGLGPFRFTSSKDNLSPVLGSEGYRTILEAIQSSGMPVIAIGGITPDDVPDILATGVHGIAIASAINQAENKQKTVQSFTKTMS